MSAMRKVKNVVNNYSPAEVKVREATSNDPWGPSSSVMSEIADLTYNVVAFSEIMTMVWKRINDHGKNWRHVYKALVLLDYIIKTGSERVAQQCKENIFAIQTLKDFQFYDKDGKDQGMNVREKSKALVALLKDDERLKTERERALKAKERFAMASQGVGSGGNDEVEIGKPAAAETTNPESEYPDSERPPAASEMEQARPQTAGEEELQLQLAIAMSKEEAAKSEQEQKSDDLRLQIALSESTDRNELPQEQATSTLLNLVETPQQTMPQPDPWGSNSQPSLPVNDPWGTPPATSSVPAVQSDPWGSGPPQPPSQPPLPQLPPSDPWSAPAPSQSPVPQLDPWGAPPPQQTAKDPWAPAAAVTAPQLPQDPDSEFDFLRNDGAFTASTAMTTQSVPPFYAPQTNGSAAFAPKTKSQTKPEDFLGENSSLVNLDSLVGPTSGNGPALAASNPFLMTQVASSGGMQAPQSNPFHQQRAPAPTINQMRQQPFVQQPVPTGTFQPSFPVAGEPALPPPLLPSGGVGAAHGAQPNPFL